MTLTMSLKKMKIKRSLSVALGINYHKLEISRVLRDVATEAKEREREYKLPVLLVYRSLGLFEFLNMHETR